MARRQLAFGAVWLASCNWIAGIHELPPNDARVAGADAGKDAADAAIDAPPACSMNGMTRCSGRVLQTCADDFWQSQTCDFTCAELGSAMQPTCVAASNMVSVAASCGSDSSTWPVLDPGSGGTITYAAGSASVTLACTTGSGSDCGQLLSASIDTSNAPGVAWFCVQSLVIEGSASLVVDYSADPLYALGLVVDGDAQIDGTVVLDGSAASGNGNAGPGAPPGPGGFAGGSAITDSTTGADGNGIGSSGGHGGESVILSGPLRVFLGGAGGGGNSTRGGAGGTASGSGVGLGGIGGHVITADWLVGGGGGGGTSTGSTFAIAYPGAGGGGAIQISARGQISIGGSISAVGGAGYTSTPNELAGTGGAAGGMILLEAPLVAAMGALIVDGGNGGSGVGAAGGAGATGSASAEPGAASTGGADAAGGGGGGGAGRIAIHSASPSCPSNVSPTYSCTPTALQGSAE